MNNDGGLALPTIEISDATAGCHRNFSFFIFRFSLPLPQNEEKWMQNSKFESKLCFDKPEAVPSGWNFPPS